MAQYYDPKTKTVSCKVGSTPEIVRKTFYGAATDPFLKYKGGRTIYPEGSVDGLIKSLQEIEKEFAEEYSDLSISGVQDCGCYGDCRCSPSYYVYGTRPATDEEVQFHIEKTEADKARREREELAELARLNEKYGS